MPKKKSESRLSVGHFVFPLIFLLVVLVFLLALQKGDPSTLPSALTGRTVPEFSLPALDGLPGEAQGAQSGFDASDLRQGKVSLLNVWASWCAPCREEHPVLMSLAASGVPIYGLNYKDSGDAARRFLSTLGNPYQRVGVDPQGRAAIGLGVYGVPETFAIDGGGRILHRHIGPMTPEFMAETLLPMLKNAPP